uniref:uncharacterized protein LOC122604461 n=1 Tax=Erigeron canadensis TaxID=72917 RepID=UPI001CB8DC1B|nr:uncharacterized protein LOC122604461 [Erigeron canadensis]
MFNIHGDINLLHPNLIEGSGDDHVKICIPLYEAAIKGDWKSARAIFDNNRELVKYSLTENGETALHIAVSTRRTKQVELFVENLVDLMNREELELQNRNYNTALYLASAAGNLKAVEIMAKKNKALLTISGGGGQIMPFYAAVLFRRYDVVKYIYDNYHKLQDDGWIEMNHNLLLEKCVELDFFGPKKERDALQLLKIIWGNIERKPRSDIDEILIGPQVTNPGCGTVDQSLELQKVFSEHVVNLQVETQNILEQDAKVGSGKKDQAQKLEQIISENVAKMQVKTQEILRGGPSAMETAGSSHPLFIAAEKGNTIFIIELIRRYPDLIWSVNNNNQSIFHIAVKHRHMDIYNLLYEIGAMKDMITSLTDDRGNNMLHLAGICVNQKRLGEVRGVAFQMQLEVLWFKEIEDTIHPSYREQKNRDGLTPGQLFLKEHKDQAAEGEKWKRDTAGLCIVVAVLVATVVFTAAFTIPGGYGQNGIPFFHSKSTFQLFWVADALSLFFSTISILKVFPYVFVMPHYAAHNFFGSLPKKLIVGITYLYLSITFMIIAFCVSFFVLCQKGLVWIPILITGFAMIPFTIYVKIQLLLLEVVIYSKFSSRFLFNRNKHVLYYQNPQV